MTSYSLSPSDVVYVNTRLKQLRAGMKREEVAKIVEPIGDPVMNSNISGMGLSVYFLKPGVGVAFQFGLKDMNSITPNDVLLTVPTSENICTLRKHSTVSQ